LWDNGFWITSTTWIIVAEFVWVGSEENFHDEIGSYFEGITMDKDKCTNRELAAWQIEYFLQMASKCPKTIEKTSS
jgi:hypothetical protein